MEKGYFYTKSEKCKAFTMKRFFILTLFFTIIASYDVVQPIMDVINKLFIQRDLRFDIIIYEQETQCANEIINGIMSESSENFTTEIKFFKSSKWHHRIDKSALVLIPNPDYFAYFNSHAVLNSTFHNPLRFLIHCESLTQLSLVSVPKAKILTDVHGHISLYEYILRDKGNGYLLETFEWYTSNGCNNVALSQINIYMKQQKKWLFELQIDEKFKNFYGCMLTIGIHTISGRENYEASQNVVLFNAMAKKGNFISHIQIMRFSKNEKGINKMLIPYNGYVIEDFQAYFIIVRLPFINNYYMKHLTTPFIEDRISFALAKPDGFTSFEKMIMPFDLLTWIFTITVFVTAFGSIFIINLTFKIVQNLFYGVNIKSPALNVLAIFFGITQTQLPAKHFPRIILVTFVMFCLVLRTAYQGVLFKIMATDMGKPLPKTIEDLYVMNYTIVINDEEDHFKEMIPEKLRYLK